MTDPLSYRYVSLVRYGPFARYALIRLHVDHVATGLSFHDPYPLSFPEPQKRSVSGSEHLLRAPSLALTPALYAGVEEPY